MTEFLSKMVVYDEIIYFIRFVKKLCLIFLGGSQGTVAGLLGDRESADEQTKRRYFRFLFWGSGGRQKRKKIGPWLALGLALGWPLAWPLAGPWPGPWLALGLALG